MKHEWLIHEAKKWVGTMEAGGENRGPIVDHIISSAGGTPGMAWCYLFCLFCADRVDVDYSKVFVLSPSEMKPNTLPRGASVVQSWKKANPNHKSIVPSPGWLIMWEHFNSSGNATGLGHAGIVTRVIDSGHWVQTVEANTGPEKNGDINRNGDGIYLRTRSAQGSPKFRVLGYLNPFPILG